MCDVIRVIIVREDSRHYVPQADLMMDPRTSAQDVMRCDLCETALVQMYCDTCLVNLCKACVGEHTFSDESKKHEILRFRKSTPLYPGCTSHDKERCELFCNPCHIPVCSTCLASNQHLGHELLKTMQVLEEKKEKIAKEKNELKEIIYPTYQGIVSDVQNRMSQLEKKCGDLSTAITKHGEDCHREIDKLVQKLKAEVEEMKTTQLHTLQKHLDEVNKKISEINDEINSMDVALDSNDTSKVFSFMSNVDEYKNLPQKILSSLPQFTPGRIQGEELCKLFGTLSSISVQSEEHGYSIKTTQKSPEAASSPVIKQLLDEPQTVTTIHIGYRNYLINVACLSDEEIWTRGEDNTMKLFSINQGSLLKSVRTKSGNIPHDIAVTNSGDLVYTDYDDRTVNIVKNEEIQKVIRLKNWKPRGVCSTSSDGLLVIMDSDDYKQSKVVRYSGSTEKQTIQFDDQSKPLYSSGRFSIKYISENRNLDICVDDCGVKAVVVVNQAGKLRFRYTGHTPTLKNKLFCPRGITTDSQSHILTADGNNHCVHIIDQDGQFLCYIDCGLSEPWGLCIDTNDNLFVAQWRKKQVKKIKYQQ
ncbi:E3 ubiquitin-protein ligase TRIM71-like [Ostrea edulis]|uniref:E3 ubiquitin-protein ligase TRIM71-like n=1 Tax=Ostrea edulis TaxID=37623 RepID=UPI0024AEC947|nr:E3 ubiquitin-protein ligase TRIM71-like [Ostrea edulis]